MDFQHLQRNANEVQSALSEVNESLIAIKPCKIYIPEHYMSCALGNIADVISIAAVYGIVVDNKYYGVSSACALMQTAPSGSNVVDIHGEKYIEFSYQVGDRVIINLNLIRTSTLVYRIYNELITKGKIPWYFDYSDLCFLFDTALLHGGANLNTDSALLELLAACMARTKANRMEFYRHHPELADRAKSPPVYIPLSSVAYGATTTTSKVLGAYFNEGLTSALVTPTREVSSVEDLLTK